MYAGFVFFSVWGYREPYVQRGKAYRKRALLIALSIGIVYGALTEVMQELLIPLRTGSVYDWIADGIGSIFGVIIVYFFLKNRNNLGNEALDK